MKKIDLHIHTVATISDSNFAFSLETFERYVREAKLDAVAVTNHDVFDAAQFKMIQQHLAITVFPGIEINVDSGHVLVIGCASELDEFEKKTQLVSSKITKVGDRISAAELKEIFEDLGRYLVIPHSDKNPALRGEALEELSDYISAGEVDSPKKFVRATKDQSKATPVLFSDSRMSDRLKKLPTRQTFVDCGELSVSSLASCLKDKTKVALSRNDGNSLWEAFESGQRLSTGLNVLIGARSSGKTYTLDQLHSAAENVKYIRQFSLVQQNEDECERKFESEIENRRSAVVSEYLSGLKHVIDEIVDIDLLAQEREVEAYVDSLLKSAEEADRQDAFSQAKLFEEIEFSIGDTATLEELIESVRQIIENVEFRPIIEKHVELSALKSLAKDLIEQLRERKLDAQKKDLVNKLVREVKRGLSVRTSATQVPDIDFYSVQLDKLRVRRFTQIVRALQREEVVFEETLQGFKIEARKGAFSGAGQIKRVSGTNQGFRDAFSQYEEPYAYLQKLLEVENLARSDLYKLFVKITYKVLNEHGFEVSGGERSEYRLLHEISDAQNYDMLLIDEPESSFDNLFLRSDVNQIIKSISRTMPVVLVTHNSTVGASVDADYLLHSRREMESGTPVYRLYSGYPTDPQLASIDGKTVRTHSVLLDSLEAGAEAYEGRRRHYETTKD